MNGEKPEVLVKGDPTSEKPEVPVKGELTNEQPEVPVNRVPDPEVAVKKEAVDCKHRILQGRASGKACFLALVGPGDEMKTKAAVKASLGLAHPRPRHLGAHRVRGGTLMQGWPNESVRGWSKSTLTS